MQQDNRGTIASLTPQIGLPRPSSSWDLQGSARTTARPTDDGGRGAPLQIPSCWMVLASRSGASGRLLCFYYPSASPYYPLIPEKRKLKRSNPPASKMRVQRFAIREDILFSNTAGSGNGLEGADAVCPTQLTLRKRYFFAILVEKYVEVEMLHKIEGKGLLLRSSHSQQI